MLNILHEETIEPTPSFMNLDVETCFSDMLHRRSSVGARVVEFGAGVVETRSVLNIERISVNFQGDVVTTNVCEKYLVALLFCLFFVD